MWQFYIPTVPPLFIPTPTQTRSPASFVLEAESLFQVGRLAEAEASYLEAIAVNPKEVAYYIELARVRMFAGMYSKAETAARDALVIDPDSALAHAVLGWSIDFQASQEQDAAIRSELLLTALTKTERAVELNPNLALVRAYYAEIIIDNSIADYEKALESYQAAMQINPYLPRLHMDIGNMMRALGDMDGALQSYTRAVALAPTNTEPLTLIATLYAGIGEFGKASQYARDAVDLDPANPHLHGNLGRMYYHNNVYKEAIIQFELAIRGGQAEAGVWVDGLPLDPANSRVVEFYYTYGLALAKQGQCEVAVPIFEALLRGVPDNEIAVFNAQEGLILCEQLSTPTPEGTVTPSP
jgi:tetratricopeptide (TPR) repeat protein